VFLGIREFCGRGFWQAIREVCGSFFPAAGHSGLSDFLLFSASIIFVIRPEFAQRHTHNSAGRAMENPRRCKTTSKCKNIGVVSSMRGLDGLRQKLDDYLFCN
jgi:hypothetical protein